MRNRARARFLSYQDCAYAVLSRVGDMRAHHHLRQQRPEDLRLAEGLRLSVG